MYPPIASIIFPQHNCQVRSPPACIYKGCVSKNVSCVKYCLFMRSLNTYSENKGCFSKIPDISDLKNVFNFNKNNFQYNFTNGLSTLSHFLPIAQIGENVFFLYESKIVCQP